MLLFRQLVAGFTIAYTLWLLPHFDFLWGADSSIPPYASGGSWRFQALTLLHRHELAGLFIVLQLLAAVLALLRIVPNLAFLVLWFTTSNLFNDAYLMTNSGNNLLLLLQFYLIFIAHPDDRGKLLPDLYRNWLTNTFWLAIKLQLCVVYLVSGLAKLGGADWLYGTALLYVFSLEEYSVWWMRNIGSWPEWIVQLLNWGSIIYMLLFPALVWLKRVKNYLLWAGILFHMLIAFGMGIFDFGMVMIVAYAAFMEQTISQRILGKFPKLRLGNKASVEEGIAA